MTTRRRWLLLVGAAAVALAVVAALVVPGMLRERHRQQLVDEIATINLEQCLERATTSAGTDVCLEAYATDSAR